MTLSAGRCSRRQASLYLSGVPAIEEMRMRYNPVQAQLIPAHVTLCREDEVDDWSALEEKITRLLPVQVTLGFGSPMREDHLVFMPAISGIEQFDELRCQLLGDGTTPPRKQLPHVTIIHPRNGHCTDAVFHDVTKRLRPFTITCRRISLIEQANGGRWRRLAEFGENDPPIA